jgi:predicted CXXCH cytochrome family protein
MKSGLRQVVSSALLAAAAVVGMTFATSAAAGISGSPHDFSARGWGSSELCIFCHTPHNAKASAGVLWNHAPTVATYTLYASSTFDAAATVGQPGATSKLCLSCHDGTVAIDSFGTRTGTTNITGDALLGTDLSNDHPIAFTYDAALATTDGGLVTPASASLVVAKVPLFAAKVECATCHNVHDNALGGFLRISNAASALCLKCHIK